MSEIPLPKVYAFDVDGVVICGRPRDGRPWATDLEADTGVSLEDLQRHFFVPYWQDIVHGRAALIPSLDSALQDMGAAVSAVDLQAYWFAQDSRINATALHLMRQARSLGRRVVLATNQDVSRARYLMDDLELRQHVDAIYASGDIGLSKPDSVFFAHIAKAEAVAPSEILLLDDQAKNIAAAAACGWQTHHVTTPEDLPGIK